MKKLIALTLALLMLLSMVACAGGTPAASTSPSASTEPSAAPSESAEPAESETPAAGSEKPSAEPESVGMYADEVDHSARDPYNIVYIVTLWTTINAGISEQFQQFGDIMNYQYTVVDAENNSDTFLNYLDVYAVQDYDGFILDFSADVAERVVEVCSELGVNWIVAVNPCVDTDGNMLWPGVTFDPTSTGEQMGQWLFDNYKTYFGDVDTKKVGLMTVTTAAMSELLQRGNGAADTLKKLFPECADTNYYFVDMTGKGMSAEKSYDEIAAVMSAHSELEYWLVATATDIYATGAARAAEALGKDATSLIICAGGTSLITDWDEGYDGCWKAALHLPEIYYAEPIISGLIAMIDGRATAETLWPEWVEVGQNYANYKLEYAVFMKDNYKSYLDDANARMQAYKDAM